MKKTQILIISLVAVLVLGITSFAVIYFATDTFKSDKDMFYKYAKQMELKEFINLEEYNNYLKRLETQGHGNEGEFSLGFTQGEETIKESIKYSRIF